MTRILFYRLQALEALRCTSMQATKIGDIWCEGWISEADMETFRLNGWWYEVQK
jgi:hypothetical protein